MGLCNMRGKGSKMQGREGYTNFKVQMEAGEPGPNTFLKVQGMAFFRIFKCRCEVFLSASFCSSRVDFRNTG